MIGAAAGLALRGRRPVCHALAAFLVMRAFEFVRTDLGIPALPVTLVGGLPGLLSEANGPTHQALEDVALMRAVPGMRIFCPSDVEELCQGLPAVIAGQGPCYVRYTDLPASVEHRTPFVEGRAEVIEPEGEIAILTYGFLLREVMIARAHLAERGLTARVVDMRCLRPLDAPAILAQAAECAALFIVEDHFASGGLFSLVADLLIRSDVHLPVHGINLEERWFRPALLPDLLALEGFSGAEIARRIQREHTRGSGPARRAPERAGASRAEDRYRRDAGRARPGADMPNRVNINRDYPDIRESDACFARASGLIPAGTQTLAKGPEQFVRGVAPKYLRRGRGCRVWDVDGNEYIDLSMAVGTISLGYRHPAVDDAIREQLAEGINFSLMHPLEVEVAELIRRVVPGADCVRFSKTGADVTSAAVRLARAFTGRDKVLACGYHGWHDWYIAVTDRDRGVPAAIADLVNTFEYGDLASLDRALDEETACVIMEPVTVQDPPGGYLREVKRRCEAKGALLIFDEMWTGFRLAIGGAQQHFDVTADLATFSKAIANGMPLSALTGRREVMALLEREAFFFTTFGGEALSLAAAKATICELVAHEVPASLRERGRQLREGVAALCRELGIDHVRVIGPDCRAQVAFDPRGGDPLEQKSLVQQEMLRCGVLWGGFHTLCQAHGADDVEQVLAAYRQALVVLRDAVAAGEVRARLRGPPVAPVFRRTTRFDTKPRT